MIKIGPRQIFQMRYQDIAPGDLICTYEVLTTRPDLLNIRHMQTYATFSHRPELNRLFHTAVIVQTYPRAGMCRIAHADGGSRKVELQEESLKDHHPGQAMLIFRAKDRALRREMVEVASQSAQAEKGHLCKNVMMDTLFQRVRQTARFFWFENGRKEASENTLRTIAQMTLHYGKNGQFYGADGTGSREMRCTEYVGNVVNVAATRLLCKNILENQQITDPEKAIHQRLRTLNRGQGHLWKFSHTETTPASLIDFLLKHPDRFETVGYLGAYSEPLEGPPLDLQKKSHPIDKSLAETKRILSIEKEEIKKASLHRTEKTLRLSLNTLALQKAEAVQIQAIANRVFRWGDFFRSTYILAPLFLGCSLAGRVLTHFSQMKRSFCEKMERDLLIVHERIRKNGALFLDLEKPLEKGLRPWVHFSLDGGTTWEQEPFRSSQKNWVAHMVIPKDKDLIYRLFIGPENLHDSDPIGKAIAWQKTERDEKILVPYRSLKDQNGQLQLGHCQNLIWEAPEIKLQGSKEMRAYFDRCNQIAPQAMEPRSIQEYENRYTALEDTLPPFSQGDDELTQHVTAFLQEEMKLQVLPEQILLMRGGLRRGLSGDPIYRISDPMGRPLLAIKVFKKSRGKFSREFFTLTNHRRFPLQTLHVPAPAGIGAAQVGDKRLYFLATEYISGISVYDLFVQLGAEKTAEERKKAFAKLLHVYQKLGTAMAEFHRADQSTPLPIHPAFQDLLQAFSTNAFLKFQGHFEAPFLQKLRQFFETHFALEQEKLFPRGYFHGDVNTGNWIYNPISDRLTLLDWPDGSFSVGKGGTPTGLAFYDIIQIRNELLTRQALGVTPEEIAQLDRVFVDTYTARGLTLPSPETSRFFNCVDLIGSLKWFIDKRACFVEANQLKLAEQIHQLKLQQLKTLIELFRSTDCPSPR